MQKTTMMTSPNLLVANRLVHGLLLLIIFIGLSTAEANQFTQSTIKQAIEDIRNQHSVAAISVLVVDKNEVLFNLHAGVKDWCSKKPFSKHNMYRIGSISKSFAGVLALRLQQQGLIDLQDSIVEYGLTPYLKNTFPKQSITLANLLEHTAGLKDLAQVEWDYNQAKPISLKQAFELNLGNHSTQWPPGRHRSYSNVGPGLFGLALELKLGQTYESLMQKYVFDPLGMGHSSLLLTAEVERKLITGYDRDGKKPIDYWHNIYRPFAAINTNNQDMLRFLQMLLQHNSAFLSPAEKQRLVQPTTTLAAQFGLTYGYGLGVYQWQVDGHNFYGHGGDADGYLTRYGYNPESGLAYLVMINAFNHQALKPIVQLLEQQITAGLAKPAYPLQLKPSREQLQLFIGTYQPVTDRFGGVKNLSQSQLRVFLKNQQWVYQYKNNPIKAIFKVKDNQFRRSNDSVATVVFIEHQEHVYLQGPMGNFIKVNQ